MISQLLCGQTMQARCFCCGAQSFEDVCGIWQKCRWCDVRLLRTGTECNLSRDAKLAQLIRVWPAAGAGLSLLDWRPTHRSLRIAATTKQFWYGGQDYRSEQIFCGNSATTFVPLTAKSTRSVGLVVLSRPNRQLQSFLDRHAHFFESVVVVLDSQSSVAQTEGNVVFVSRPLNGDFAAQRNFGTHLARTNWVLHLDTDETVDRAFYQALPHLAIAADEEGLRAIGFPRRNFVNSTLSDLFPDIQYRLIRRDILFEGCVHERPEPCRTGTDTIVSQHGAIDHLLDRERVLMRSSLYDELGQDKARHADDAALLREFQP